MRFWGKINKSREIIYPRGDLMKLRIEFRDDLAKQIVEQAKEWEERSPSGKEQPLTWEVEEYHAPEKIRRVGNDAVLETKSTKVTLHKAEIDQIIKLFKR